MVEEKKFYQKKWFTLLLLVLLAPIGIIVLWVNKHWTKKTRTILSVVFGIYFIFIVIAGEPTEEEKAEEEAKQEQLEKEKAEEKAKAKEEAKKKEETEKKEKERKANRSIDEALEEDSNKIDKATLKNGELSLVSEPGTLWSENSIMGVVHDMFKVVNKGFKDDNVDSIMATIKVNMVDQKGNEKMEPVVTFRYSRESFEELNYDKFINMSLAEEWRILNQSDSYFVHLGIKKELKDKYIQNLK